MVVVFDMVLLLLGGLFGMWLVGYLVLLMCPFFMFCMVIFGVGIFVMLYDIGVFLVLNVIFFVNLSKWMLNDIEMVDVDGNCIADFYYVGYIMVIVLVIVMLVFGALVVLVCIIDMNGVVIDVGVVTCMIMIL